MNPNFNIAISLAILSLVPVLPLEPVDGLIAGFNHVRPIRFCPSASAFASEPKEAGDTRGGADGLTDGAHAAGEHTREAINGNTSGTRQAGRQAANNKLLKGTVQASRSPILDGVTQTIP